MDSIRYLLDTNIYIASYDRYYRHDFFPSYWESFSKILNTHVVIPKIVQSEITKSPWFHQWLKLNYSQDIISHKLYAEQYQDILQYIEGCGLYKETALTNQSKGWANDSIADPWIIGIAQKEGLTVVTDESKDPNLGKGQLVKSAKIPDVCSQLDIRCIDRNTFFQEVRLLV